MNKKIKIILTISLLLNILFIGFHVGIFMKKQWHGHHKKPLYVKFLNNLEHLPKSQQQQLSKKLNTFQQQEISSHKKIKQLYSEIFDLLLEPKFKPDLYERKNQQLTQLKQQKDTIIKKFIKETALSLNQKQRKKFFKMLRKCDKNKRQ